MANKRRQVILLHGNNKFDTAKANELDLQQGELVVEHGSGSANVKIHTLDSGGTLATFVTNSGVTNIITATTYTQEQINNKLSGVVTSDDVYTKTEVDTHLKTKSDTGHTHSDYLTKSDVSGKLDTNTFNTYTGTTNTTLSGLSDTVDTINTALSGKLDTTTFNNFIGTANDADNLINKFKEVENFLSGITESETLTSLLLNKLNTNTFNSYTGTTNTTLSGLSDTVDTINEGYISGGTITYNGTTDTTITGTVKNHILSFDVRNLIIDGGEY